MPSRRFLQTPTPTPGVTGSVHGMVLCLIDILPSTLVGVAPRDKNHLGGKEGAQVRKSRAGVSCGMNGEGNGKEREISVQTLRKSERHKNIFESSREKSCVGYGGGSTGIVREIRPQPRNAHPQGWSGQLLKSPEWGWMWWRGR